jgi:magnesium chelatase family protein
MRQVFLPKGNVPEASVIPDIDVIGVENIKDVVAMLTGERPLEKSEKLDISKLPQHTMSIDFASIHGQEQAKRALLIAAAG